MDVLIQFNFLNFVNNLFYDTYKNTIHTLMYLLLDQSQKKTVKLIMISNSTIKKLIKFPYRNNSVSKD